MSKSKKVFCKRCGKYVNELIGLNKICNMCFWGSSINRTNNRRAQEGRMKKRIRLKKLKGDIWNLKPILTDVEIHNITKEYKEEFSTLDDGDVIAIEKENFNCACRDIERNIIEKLQNKL